MEERQCKHKQEYYTCKRLRLLIFLRNKGFMPEQTVPDVYNPKYMVWKFRNCPALEDAIDEWFAQYNKE